MKLKTKYKVRGVDDKINELSLEDIKDIVNFYLKHNKIDNIKKILKKLDKDQIEKIKNMIFSYIMKLDISDYSLAFDLSKYISEFLNEYSLILIFDKFCNDSNIDEKNVSYLGSLTNFIQNSVTKDTKALITKYINETMLFDDFRYIYLLSFVSECKYILSEEHLSKLVTIMTVTNKIDAKIDFIKILYDVLSDNHLDDLVNSIISQKSCSKLLYLSTVLSKNKKYFNKIKEEIQKIGDAEYIYHFANQYYKILSEKEKQELKLSILKTRNDLWIAYYAVSLDKSLINDYYGSPKNLFKTINLNNNINAVTKESINKLLLTNDTIVEDLFK